MRASLLLLLVSLAGNVALFALLARPTRNVPPSDEAQPAAEPETNSVVPSVGVTTATTNAGDASSPPSWSAMFSTDPGEFAQRLSKAGFPPAIVRAIIEEEIARGFRAERLKLAGDDPSAPYWQVARRSPDAAVARRMMERDAERQKLLRDALGPRNVDDDEMRLGWLRRTYGVSDPQKLAQLSLILEDYQQVGAEARPFAFTNPTERELAQETQRMIQGEQLADIKALLTPEEFAAYEMRAGPIANGLRNALSDFGATEGEYRALFHAYRAGVDAAEPTNFDRSALLERARGALPPQRYADLQQALAPGATWLNRFASRLGLPLSAVAPVQQGREELRERANAVHDDPSLTAEQRAAQLATITAEARQRVASVLGERLLPTYEEVDGGWIRDLATRGRRREFGPLP